VPAGYRTPDFIPVDLSDPVEAALAATELVDLEVGHAASDAAHNRLANVQHGRGNGHGELQQRFLDAVQHAASGAKTGNNLLRTLDTSLQVTERR
jgi:hypothetical protein